ncbi:MAG: carbohydrate-binding protein [Gammaproteobacteria bacterium HGW-Gammaproteobacteria-3]|nr:MAG: carbohydrate-binding protein [Gammaproteobacteria bacterium HGW-Gammaproteobacteria-3]
MRKRIIAQAEQNSASKNEQWLDLANSADVEISSEDEGYPIESALLSDDGPGWRADAPGAQTIRLVFEKPQALSRIQLIFKEPNLARTQEFVLRGSEDGGRCFREIARQQWNFSLEGSMTETEDYTVKFDGVTVLELTIIPDISGDPLAVASLARLRLA